MVALLLKNGADCEMMNNSGVTPLLIAETMEDQQLLDMFCSYQQKV